MTALVFLLIPVLVICLCRRFPLFGKMGPVLVLYVIGVVIGNVWHPADLPQVQEILSSAMVPLAIPLMLFSCRFSRSGTRSQILALVTGLVAVIITVTAGYFIFGKHIGNAPKIAGLMAGTYTGGTMNLAALKEMLDVPEDTFVLLNAYDMLVSFIYMTFLLTFGIRFFRRILPNETSHEDTVPAGTETAHSNPYQGIFTARGLKDAGFLLGLDIVIIGLCAVLGYFAGDGWFMTVLILSLTTCGIAASFLPQVRKRSYGYEIGMYFIYVFSVVVASMADLSGFEIGDGLATLSYLTFVIFGSLLIQVVLAGIFRIDADTMTISSLTYICSPPFVPMMSAAMKNRDILAPGLAIGVFGYAIGNYLGFLMQAVLSTF